MCQSTSQEASPLVRQRQADLDFHDIVAAANPNPFLPFGCANTRRSQRPPAHETASACARS